MISQLIKSFVASVRTSCDNPVFLSKTVVTNVVNQKLSTNFLTADDNKMMKEIPEGELFIFVGK